MLLVLQVAPLELAAPAGNAIAPQPVIVTPPSVKPTVPVGAVPATVAVKVTLAPTSDGLGELESVVVVGASPTVTVTDAAAAGELSAIGVVTAPVPSTYIPAVVLVTVTLYVQVTPAGMEPEDKATLPPPGAAVRVPVQPAPVMFELGVPEFTRLAG